MNRRSGFRYAIALLLCMSSAHAQSLEIEGVEADAVPGVLGGPFSALPFMPGSSTILSPVPLVGVRGQQPAATAYFYDGVRIPTVFHLVAGPTLMPEGSVAGWALERGIAPANVRGVTGGVVSIAAPVDLPTGVSGAAALDLLSLSTTASWASADGETEATIGGGSLWTPFLYSQLNRGAPTWDASRRNLRAELFSYLGRVERKVGSGDLRLLAVGVIDGFSQASSTDLLGGGLTFHRVDGRVRQLVGGGLLEAGVLYGRDSLSGELGGPISQMVAESSVTTLGVRASYDVLIGERVDLSVGVDSDARTADLTQRWRTAEPEVEGAPRGAPILTRADSRIGRLLVYGGWAEAALRSADWRWTLGLRADGYELGGERFAAVDPRVTVWRQLDERWSLSAGAALTHSPPVHLVPLAPVDVAAVRFGLQELVQTQAELRWQLAPDSFVALSVFANPIRRAIESSPLDRDFLQTVKASPESVEAPKRATGLDAGAELVLRKLYVGDWFGWASYSLLYSRRELGIARRNEYGEPVAVERARVQPAWTRGHVANVVLGRTLGKWTFSGALQLQSGTPEAGGLSSFTQKQGLDRLRLGPKWVDEDLDRLDTLPPFFRADVRVARAFAIGPVRMEGSLDVQNLAFGREVVKYGYSDDVASLSDRAAGNQRLVRTAGTLVPAVPLPMLGLRAMY